MLPPRLFSNPLSARLLTYSSDEDDKSTISTCSSSRTWTTATGATSILYDDDAIDDYTNDQKSALSSHDIEKSMIIQQYAHAPDFTTSQAERAHAQEQHVHDFATRSHHSRFGFKSPWTSSKVSLRRTLFTSPFERHRPVLHKIKGASRLYAEIHALLI